MSSINEAKRLIKRIILTNIFSEDMYLTPLLSGKHGIGKSSIMKSVSKDINADLIIIEGGTLKEGEITGLPYQYKKGSDIEFRFLPYYAIKQIQDKELNMNIKENLSTKEKLSLIKDKKIRPTIVFIDELNRTDNSVYRELMNIILTKTVNGYKLPWWVFFTSAINPSSMDSMYATNEMDPAQLDRFIKIDVSESLQDFIDYTLNKQFDKSLISFLTNNGIYLSSSDIQLEDSCISTPSPRGWEMINYILKSKNYIKPFFNSLELKFEDIDIKTIISCKVGSAAATAYMSFLENEKKLITSDDIFKYDTKDIENDVIESLSKQSTAMNSITNRSIIEYLIKNYDEDNMKYHDILHSKVKKYMDVIDKPSKLIFAELLTNNNTIKKTSLYDEFYDLFDEDLINMIYKNIDNESVLANG